jgi:hypothetical protein
MKSLMSNNIVKHEYIASTFTQYIQGHMLKVQIHINEQADWAQA